MVKTKVQLKIKVDEWLDDRTEPFKTCEVHDDMRKVAGNNIRLSPQRLQNYIRSTNKAKFIKNKKIWEIKTKCR